MNFRARERSRDAAYDLGGEADAEVLEGAAPFVRALVGVGDDELVDRVALGP